MNSRNKRLISYSVFGIILGIVGRTITINNPDIPLYLNFFGVMVAAYYSGFYAGTIVSAATVLYGTVYSMIIDSAYVGTELMTILPMMVAAVFIGNIARPHHAFERVYNTFGTYALIATVRSIVMICINGINHKGCTGLTMYDEIIDYQDAINGLTLFKYILPSMMAAFIDTFITLFTLFFITKIVKSIKNLKNKDTKNVTNIFLVAVTFGIVASIFFGSTQTANAMEGDNFVQRIYNSEHGLLGGAANCMVQTRDGCIWVGTYGGIYKFDGNTFTMMRNIPQARSVESLYVDDEDNLWISSNGTGLVVRTPEGVYFTLSDDDGLPSNTVRAVVKAKDQIYYVGTVDEIAIVRFNGASLQVIGTVPDIIYAKRLAVTQSGRVVAVTSKGAAYLIQDGEILDTFSSDEFINDVFVSSEAKVCLAGNDANLHLVSVEKDSFNTIQTLHFDELDSIKDVLVSSDGITYMSGGDCVGYINDNNTFTAIQTGDFNNSIDRIMEDFQGNIWFTSSRCGILELSSSPCSNLFDVCNIKNTGTNTVKEWNGLLYVGSDEGLTVIDESKSETVENYYTEFFDGVRIRSLGVDNNNNLWVCTQTNGAYEIVSETEMYNYTTADGLPDNRARCTKALSDGRVVIATYAGISFVENHKLTKSLVTNQDMSPAYALCIEEVDEHTILAGTNGDGICVIVDGKVERYITHKDGIPSGVILNLYKDENGDGYFVLSGSGMCYMYPDYKVKEFSEFPFYNNTDLFQTSNGKVVVLSTAGIYVVNYNDLMSFKAMNSTHIDESRGLPGGITSNARNYLTDDDILYFAGNTGVYKLDCRNYDTSVSIYKTIIKSIDLDGTKSKVNDDGLIEVPAGVKKISFDFGVFNFTKTDPYVRYCLEGADEKPVTVLASALQEIVYYGIPSGTHLLTIEVLDSNQSDVLSSDTYTIVKDMELYEKLSFKIFYAFGMILIAVTLIVWIAIIVIDTSEKRRRKKYSEALSVMEKEKAEALEKSLQREEMANRSKSDFLANMSHEIRTPINAIIGMDAMILRESNQSEIRGYAQNIYGASNTLLSLINDILDFSKIESGKMELVPDEYNLGSLINDIIVMMRPKAEAKQLQFNVEVNPEIPVDLFGDEGRIKQIIINILNNAVKYTEKGSVTLKVDYGKLDEENIALNVCVSDTGIGIKKEDLGKLFLAFDRIEENRNKNIEGTGLGMSITKNLLALMNSELNVESVYGEGSDFSFAIVQPVRSEKKIGNYEDYEMTEMDIAGQKEDFHAPDADILVVDDVEMNLIVVKSLLKRIQSRVDTADSGFEAIEKAKTKKYDIIFLDAMMPKMDGVETLNHIKAECELNSDTPVIMLTANAIKGAREEYLEKGFSNYLSKPIDEKELDRMICEYLPDDKKIMQGSEMFDSNDAAGSGDTAGNVNDFWTNMENDPEIDVKKGVEAAGGKDTYEVIVKNFYETSLMRINLLKELFEKMDVENYTIQVHALKSSARLVGATALSELAFELEMAGKDGDTEKITNKTPDVISMYENLYNKFSTYFGTEKADDDSRKKEITVKKLKRKLGEIKEIVEAFDIKSAREAFDELSEKYAIPEEYEGVFAQIRMEFAEVNRDRIIEIIDSME